MIWDRIANLKEAKGRKSFATKTSNYSLDFQAELSAPVQVPPAPLPPPSPLPHFLTCRRGPGKIGAGRKGEERSGHPQRRCGRPGSPDRRKAESGGRHGKR